MKDIKIRAMVSDKQALDQALSFDKFELIYAYEGLLNADTPNKEKIIAVPNVFLGDCEEKTFNRLRSLKDMGFNHCLAHTASHLPIIKKADMTAHGGMRLNITNSLSAEFFETQGLCDIILSCELTSARIKNIKSNIPIGIMGYGRIPLMIARRCPVKDGKVCEYGGNGESGKGCGRYLTDRQGKRIRLLCSNTVELLNPDILNIGDKKSDFPTVDFMLMMFTGETDLISIANDFISGKKPKGDFTRGLYYRGVE